MYLMPGPVGFRAMPKHLDPIANPPSARQPRISQRVSIDAQIAMRRQGLRSWVVRARDLSPEGCRIDFVEQPRLDEHVLVKFNGLEALAGVVCWVDANSAGVRFDRPIHAAVFAHFVTTLR